MTLSRKFSLARYPPSWDSDMPVPIVKLSAIVYPSCCSPSWDCPTCFFFIGELSVRIGPCDMVFSIIGDFGMVFSIVGLSVTDSPSWTPPLWMIFALAGSSGMAFSIEVRPTQTPAGNVCLFWFVARSLMSSKDDRPAMSVALSPSSFFASQRVSVMYVCFGFLLARLCKDDRLAMSIAISPSSFFCFAACACHCT